MSRIRHKAWIAACLMAGPPGAAWALSLRGSAGEMVVEGLRPGRSHSLEALTGRRLEVTNTGPERVEFVWGALAPAGSGLKDGYAGIRPAWVRVSREAGALASGESHSSDARVVVPRGIRGGRYQLDWVTEGRAPGGATLALRSRLLLHVGPQPRRIAAEVPLDQELRLLPGEVRLTGVPLGVPVVLGAGQRPGVKVAFLGRGRAAIDVFVAEGGPRPPQAYERAPNPAFLQVRGGRLRAGGGRVAVAELVLEVPDEPRYRGRKWMFVVGAQRTDGQDRAMALTRILVETMEE